MTNTLNLNTPEATDLALVAAHPGDVTTLVAHEPPLLATLPDADRAFAAERDVQAAYHAKGWGQPRRLPRWRVRPGR
jgi:hypothetical protein